MATKGAERRGFVDIFLLIIFSPLYLLAKLIPKDRKLYVYGSSLGMHFADNSKYLFLYASKTVKNIESVFISRNNQVIHSLREAGYRAEYLNSFRGILTVVCAEKAFLSHSTRDIHPLLLGGAEIIQLWHGTPLKKIGYDADWRCNNTKSRIKNTVRRIVYFLFPFIYSSRVFGKIIVSSEEIVASYQTAFGIKRKKIEIIGQPRNDCLNSKYIPDKKIFDELEYLEDLRKKFRLIVAWLPTHRVASGKTAVDMMREYGFDDGKFGTFLRDNNIGFIAKPHFLERDALKDKAKISENFIVYDYIDPYPLLRYTDLLITDYSSIYFDFLLTERPIVFTPFDWEEYRRTEADFYYDYDEVTPGPKCRDWDEIMVELKKALDFQNSPTPDSFKSKRMEICTRFNYYKDDFSRRITERFFNSGG